ncbi:hypothetical protein Tco_0622776 [Tanacetum coccineum]
MHSEGDDSPLTKLSNTIKGTYMFGMEIPDTMINNAFKQSTGYKYYKARKAKSKKAKADEEPEEQNVSLVKSGKGKGYMRSGDNEANVPKMFKKDVMPRKTRSLTVAEETFAVELAKSINTSEESANETNDADDLDTDLTDDEHKGDYDTVRYGVLKYNKSTEIPKSTYFSLTITSSSLDFIQNLLDETPSFLSGASEVPFGTHVDVQATNLVLQEMFSDDAAHHISSPPANITRKLPTNPQLNTLQAKAKTLMQKAKKNMRKINFKKADTQNFIEYDQKLENLTNINVSEAFEKAVQARVLIDLKKLLPTHIPKAIANYVRPRLNTSVLEVMKNNQINLFTKPLTNTDDLLKLDLKIKLLHRIQDTKSNVTHPTHQKLYENLHESIFLDHDALNTQDAKPSFYKRSHDNQDPPNDHATKRRTTWFDLLLKLDINQNENHILGPSIVAITKKHKALIQKDKLTTTDLEGAGLEKLKQQRSDNKEYAFSYADLPRLGLNDVEDMYLL